jgi:hypothetical protein
MIDTKMITNTNINTPFDIICRYHHISNLVLLRVELQTFAFVVIVITGRKIKQ